MMNRGIDARNRKSRSQISIAIYATASVVVAILFIVAWGLSSTPTGTGDRNLDVKMDASAMDQGLVSKQDVNAILSAPRTGVTMLVAYPLAITPDPHIDIDESAYPWIARTINNGETPISIKEFKEFFSVVSTGNTHYFAIKYVDGSVKPYSIEFYEVPLSLDQYNVKAYKLDVTPDNFITVNLKDQPWLQKLVDESHTWQPIDIASAKVLKQLSDSTKTFNFKVIYSDGHSEYYNIRYAGPALSALS